MALPSDLNTRWFQAFTTDAGGTPALNVVLAGGTMAGPLLLTDGALGTPSLAFALDTDNGIYRPGANRMGFGGGSRCDLYISSDETLIAMRSGEIFGWTGSATDASATAQDTTLVRTAAGSIGMGGIGNGQVLGLKQLTELTTINVAASTDTAISIPVNAIVIGVSVRVTVTIPTSVTFTVTGATSGTAFQTGATVATAAGTTDVGTKNCPFLNTAAQLVRITPNVNPGSNAGRVRVTIHYLDITAPTS